MSYQYPTPTRSGMSATLKWILAGVGLLVVLGVAGMVVNVATKPAQLVNKTLDTNNIIHNYEWFYDVDAAYRAKLGQITVHKSLAAQETVPAERSRLQMELAAMQQSCRELVTKYNANSEKVNRSLFKSNNLPETLDINRCEVK